MTENDLENPFVPFKVIATSGAGISAGQSRWTMLESWTSAPVGAATLTCDTTDLVEGMPIRYQTVAGGDTYYYSIITSVDSTSIDIAGPSLSGAVVVNLEVGTPEMVVQVDLFVGGLYAATAQTILFNVASTYFQWQFAAAKLVEFHARAATAGGGSSPKVNITIGGVSVDTNGVIVSTSWNASAAIDKTKYSIAHDDDMNIAVSTIHATQTNLTMSLTFVLE